MDSARPTPKANAGIAHAQTREELAGLRKFLTAAAFLLLCFCLPLYQVTVFALHSEFSSYIILIPFISGYLAWIERPHFYPTGATLPAGWAIALWTGGLGLLIWAALTFFDSTRPELVELLGLTMYAMVLLLAGFACHFLGRRTLRYFAFPLAFLLFLAPFSAAVENSLETFLQHGSSMVAQAFFEVAGMPVLRTGTYFQLPGFNMQVAPECSGLRSSMALFLTSLVAGQLFLRSPWKRAILVLIVLPLALLRNGFRVFVIGELCVQIRPEMIDSWIHHHGGPLFFGLSLIPFSFMLYYLYKSENPSAPPARPPQN